MNNFLNRRALSVAGLLITIIGLATALFLVQQSQDIRNRAQEDIACYQDIRRALCRWDELTGARLYEVYIADITDPNNTFPIVGEGDTGVEVDGSATSYPFDALPEHRYSCEVRAFFEEGEIYCEGYGEWGRGESLCPANIVLTGTVTPTESVTPTISITPGGPTLSPSVSPTISISPTISLTITPGGPSLSPTMSITPGGPTYSPTPSRSPTPTLSITPGSPTLTPTRTPTPTVPAATPSVTPTHTPTPTPTPRPSNTPTPTLTTAPTPTTPVIVVIQPTTPPRTVVITQPPQIVKITSAPIPVTGAAENTIAIVVGGVFLAIIGSLFFFIL